MGAHIGRLTAVAAVVFLASSVAGCTADPFTPISVPLNCATAPIGDVTLVLGARQNSPAPALSGAVAQLVKEAAKLNRQIKIIQLDGAPSVAFRGEFRTSARNSIAKAADLSTFMAVINKSIESLRPKAAEADVLFALSLAAHETASGGIIAMMDSGVQTTGALRFQDSGVLGADPDDIVSYLGSKKLLPDMNGKKLVLVGFGETALPQPALSMSLSESVIETWKAIATRGNAACVEAIGLSSAGPAVPTDVSVTIVAVPTGPAFAPCASTVLPETALGFVPDRATFRDPEAATSLIRTLAAFLNGKPQKVTLIGTTASGGSEQALAALSKARADAVKVALVQMGVPADQITTIGAGTHSAYHVNDRNSDGTLDPALAARNRSVIVQLECSP